MGSKYRVEMEATQTEVDPTTGEVGIRSGERRPVGHKDVGLDWRPVIVEEKEDGEASQSDQGPSAGKDADKGASTTQQQGASTPAKSSGAK